MEFELNKIPFKIDNSVFETFKKYIQDDNKKEESGGVLIGKVYDNHIEILDCSEPTQFDKRSRYNFNRSFKSAQEFIDMKFESSQGKEIYLGEWHTHPENNPRPSGIDLKNFEKSLKNNILNSDTHFMIIIGITSIYIGVYIDKKQVDNLRINNKDIYL